MQGVVKWFNDGSGYGFIEAEGKHDIFIHFTDIVADTPEFFRTLTIGQHVSFELDERAKGLVAKKCVKIEPGEVS